MLSNTNLGNESQRQDMNSNDQVSSSQLKESKVDDESRIEEVTKLPLNMSEKFYLQYYVLFENKSNNCWLNSALALLLNNRTLYCNLKSKNDTLLVKILQHYRDIMMYVLSPTKTLSVARLSVASNRVKFVQELALAYLQPLLKCKDGKPDSAFNAVMNLIGSDAKAHSLFVASLNCSMECENCKAARIKSHKKSVITLTKVESFNGSNLVSLCACPACKVPDQKMFLHYQSLPPCLLFHFENGAGEGVLEQVDFQVGARTYHLTGVITLQDKNGPVPHFVTWVRNPDSDQWLLNNDLGPRLTSFKSSNPRINRCIIHMLCFEALDQMGVITNFSGLVSTNKMPCNYAEIPEITLSDDNEEKIADQNQLNCSSTANSKNFFEGAHNHFETNPPSSTNRAVSISSPSVSKKSINAVSVAETFVEKEKCVSNGASSSGATASFSSGPQIESNDENAINESSSKSPKKKGSNPKPKALTEYEERLLNMTVEDVLLNTVFPYFRLGGMND
ncbi:uncharacterized protein LOC129217410 [Uloborus diversus]|uniref:uncharacterized protein LOC129217410 n=1 Tax=Uloborus diversus TaxID=327109 RepID=UPI00240A7B08|nr:uncharacterized protein LOC129217410 [Uloborus diversus]